MANFKYIIALLTLIYSTTSAFATHNRAGEITYRHISGYTFEITVTTYTYDLSEANRTELDVSWGDDTYETVRRVSKIELPNNYLHNTYVAQHTFPGTGIYQILMEDPNRNLGVKNIPNSVNTIFSIKTTMLIGPFTGTNSTPVLLNPPIDNAALNHIFIHNPSAYDPDGDSISYQLTICTAEDGELIEGYTLPPASESLILDAVRGDLVWTSPVEVGVYNIAMYVDEWRDGVRIGRIARDMQIDVYETDNNPPVISPIADYCVEAGDTIEFEFTVTDADNDPIELEITGGPIIDGSASYDIMETSSGFLQGIFTWVTNCDQAQNQPYNIVFKAEDIVNEISLVDISSIFVQVLHSAPENPELFPGTDTIRVEWDASECGYPSGYNIYRKIGSYGFIPDSCENGVPAYTGYELLDKVSGKYTNAYTDDNLGQGLVPGFDYCYMITAYYSDNAESFASTELCTTLVSGTPPMLQVSVLENDETAGSIFVSWAVPQGVDTIDDGPYRYDVYRQSPDEDSFAKIESISSIDLTDTTFLDENINTMEFPYYYSVTVSYLSSTGNWIDIPGSEIASSVYLDLQSQDNLIDIEILKRAPWLNYEHHIFRKSEDQFEFDSIGKTNDAFYSDDNLPNGIAYTYKSRSLGMRPLYGKDYFVENLSHSNTATAIDTVSPCPPELEVESVCDSAFNLLSWSSPFSICGSDDVIQYQIYYKATLESEFELIATQGNTDTTFKHDNNLETLAAVYAVAAVDSFYNVSDLAVAIIDTCLMYGLPNVFSPNGDGVNDVYVSYNLGGFIQEVDMKIFNRYGQAVYTTSNPDIEWDGYHKDSKQLVSSGVYYYICDVYEPRLTGIEHYTLNGFIHVYSGESNIVE